MNDNTYFQQFNSCLIKSFDLYLDKPNDKNELVYHYTSPSAFLSIIKSNTLRFTDISYMNDKSESIFFVKRLLEFLDDNKHQFPYFSEVVYNLLKNNDFSKIKKLETFRIKYSDVPKLTQKSSRIFAFCTCKKPDLLNMWNYYLNNRIYEGYCIGFNYNKLLKSFDITDAKQLNKFIVYYGNILYKKKEHFLKIEELAKTIETDIANSTNEQTAIQHAHIDLRNYIDSRGVFYKDSHFANEKEFRIVIDIEEQSIPRNNKENRFYEICNFEMKEDFTTKLGLIVPYLNVSFLKEAIEKITIAPTMEYAIAKKSVEELLKSYDIKATVHKSKIPIRF